jgi:hypothetical protein
VVLQVPVGGAQRLPNSAYIRMTIGRSGSLVSGFRSRRPLGGQMTDHARRRD